MKTSMPRNTWTIMMVTNGLRPNMAMVLVVEPHAAVDNFDSANMRPVSVALAVLPVPLVDHHRILVLGSQSMSFVFFE